MIILKKYDFKKNIIKGVTSISCDHHKYGMAPKGVSIVFNKQITLFYF